MQLYAFACARAFVYRHTFVYIIFQEINTMPCFCLNFCFVIWILGKGDSWPDNVVQIVLQDS